MSLHHTLCWSPACLLQAGKESPNILSPSMSSPVCTPQAPGPGTELGVNLLRYSLGRQPGGWAKLGALGTRDEAVTKGPYFPLLRNTLASDKSGERQEELGRDLVISHLEEH